MKLVRFNFHVERPQLARLGCVLPGDLICDLRALYARYLRNNGDFYANEMSALLMPRAVAAFLQGGKQAAQALSESVSWGVDLSEREPDAVGNEGERLFAPLAECRLHAPVRLGKLVTVRPSVDGAFVIEARPTGAVVGPTRHVVMPQEVDSLRYSGGVGMVIGRRCMSVREPEALDVVAGYMVMSQFSCDTGPYAGNTFTRGMFESFSPSGPWLTLAEAAPEAGALEATFRAGAATGHFAAADLPWSLGKIIAYLSPMGLDAGDIIWFGPSPASELSVRLDDVATTAVSGIGEISNPVKRVQATN